MSKKQPKLTGWFEKKRQPARIGVYETRQNHDEKTWYSFWDGSQWRGEWYTPQRAANYASGCFGMTATHWRGLAVKP